MVTHPGRSATSTEFFAEDLIESRIGVHDSDHFEVKLDYAIHPRLRRSRYRVESYFFIPQSLGINRHTYAARDFYADIQAYVRLKTPAASLSDLADPANDQLPLNRLSQMLAELRTEHRSSQHRQQVSQQLRMFGCMVRASLRDDVRALRDLVGELRASTQPRVLVEDLRRGCERLNADLQRMLSRWRALRTDFLDTRLPRTTCESYRATDEYISLLIENRLATVLKQVDGVGDTGATLTPVREKLRDLLLAERDYREGAGYPSRIGRSDSDDEAFIYRQGLLKRFVMSVLWLEVDKDTDHHGAAQLGAAIAAGIAMFLALAASLFQSHWYMVNTWGFVIAGTLIYMLKDRMKDWLKGYFSSKMTRWLADYDVRIKDPVTGRQIGRCREAFNYLTTRQVPPQVSAARRNGSSAKAVAELGKPEVVLKYEKDIALAGTEIIEGLNLKHYDINDIMRFAVSRLVARADDPVTTIPLYEPQKDRVGRRSLRKVYHLNVVMVLKALTTPAHPLLRRIRVVLDKQGIRRLEIVS